jgi:hypothetical protein
MALIIGGRPKHIPVPLGGGVTLLVRPATYAEIQIVSAEIAPSIAALIAGSAAGADLAPLLGEEFNTGGEFGPAQAQAAGDKLGLIELLMVCAGDMTGRLLGPDKQPLPWPDKGTAALLASDTTIARRLRAVVEAGAAEESREGEE